MFTNLSNSKGVDQVSPDIAAVFTEVFKVDDLLLSSTIRDIKAWDSLGHMNLIVAIEKRFDIKFDFTDIVKLTSVESIQQYLIAKGVLT